MNKLFYTPDNDDRGRNLFFVGDSMKFVRTYTFEKLISFYKINLILLIVLCKFNLVSD